MCAVLNNDNCPEPTGTAGHPPVEILKSFLTWVSRRKGKQQKWQIDKFLKKDEQRKNDLVRF